MKKNVVVVLLFGIFIVFGVISSVALYRDVSMGISSKAWPVVKGEVVMAVRRSSGSNLKNFEYRYTLGSTTYRGSQVAFIRVPYIDPVHEKYTSGMMVSVYYDAQNPEKSVIEPGAPVLGIVADSLAGIAMFSVGVFGFYFNFRRQ